MAGGRGGGGGDGCLAPTSWSADIAAAQVAHQDPARHGSIAPPSAAATRGLCARAAGPVPRSKPARKPAQCSRPPALTRPQRESTLTPGLRAVELNDVLFPRKKSHKQCPDQAAAEVHGHRSDDVVQAQLEHEPVHDDEGAGAQEGDEDP
jgi:hypothetical protein